MFLIYCDETGDPGAAQGTTPYFIVSAMIVHQESWDEVFNRIREFRRKLRFEHDIPLSAELKGHYVIHGSPEFKRVRSSKKGRFTKWERLVIMKKTVEFMARLSGLIEVQNVCLRKAGQAGDQWEAKEKAKIRFIRTWEFTLQRIETHCYNQEKSKQEELTLFQTAVQQPKYPIWINNAAIERAIVLPDQTQNDELRKLCRKMHVFNYVPYRHSPGEELKTRPVPIKHVLGDPFFHESHHSYFVQCADIIGYCLAKHFFPSSISRKLLELKVSNRFKLKNFFLQLEPILCKKAAPEHPLGVKFVPDQ